ncbi:MAG TPA: metalloregulator ArsR/SmtB family transcription factor [Myxococcaceae bacterium]|nr:metalloregulator ArsR/SmtB family transcription factor [Myxococcaceae bacterium]
MARASLARIERVERLNGVFAALADPTRRAILERLARGEASVTEVAEPFGMSLNAVSKHIRVLERSGLVRRRVAGRHHYLVFDHRPLADADGWLGRARAFWNARLDELEKVLRERE